MTSIEWLMERYLSKEHSLNIIDFDKAKEMHKQEMEKVSGDWWNEGASYMYDGKREYNSFEQYYQETFVSKGSGDHIVDTNEMISTSTISDKWKEYQDWLNEVPEISNEEIRNKSIELFRPISYQECFEEGAKWYREQLKKNK
jgi:hypothetical protein